MHQGPELHPNNRRQIRRFVTKVAADHPSGTKAAQVIRDFYFDWQPCKAYALAYLAALQTAEPLQWQRKRDSGS